MSKRPRIYPVPSKDPRSVDVRSWFEGDRFNVAKKPAGTEYIVVISGDGGMLRVVPRYYMYGVPFLGINRGTRGCTMNAVDNADQLEALLNKDLKIFSLKLLKVTFTSKTGKESSYLAFNDVYLNAKSGTEVQGVIRGERYHEKEFRGDGIIVATAQGSTAYNRSAGGAVLPLDSDHFAVCTICQSAIKLPIRDVINPQKIEIEVTRGTAIGHADTEHKEVVGVKRVVIEPSPFEVRLAFDPDFDFEMRRYL